MAMATSHTYIYLQIYAGVDNNNYRYLMLLLDLEHL